VIIQTRGIGPGLEYQRLSETQRGGKVVDGVVKTMHEIADSSKKIASRDPES
jgi:hypothetical protein